jgi:transcriptional regulator with XRE-family HTH domain
VRELGEYLRNERIRRGYSLKDIQEQTKIRMRYLEAIENGEFQHIAAEVYVKGFLRSYAEAIGLNGWDVVARYQGLKAEQEAEIEEEKPRRAPRRRTRRRSLRPAFFLLLLVGGLIYLFGFRSEPGVQEVLPEEPVPPAEEIVVDEPIPEAVTVDEPEPVMEMELPSLPEVTVEESFSFSPVEIPAEDPLIEAVLPEEPELPDEPPVEEPPRASFVLEVVVEETCWFEVHADGERIVYRNLEAGEEARWEAEHGLWVRIGNPVGVKAFFNGEPVSLPTRTVATLQYGEGGRKEAAE